MVVLCSGKNEAQVYTARLYFMLFPFFHGGWFWYAGWVFGCGSVLVFFFGFVVLCFSVVLLCVREDNVSSFSHGRLL